MTSAMTTKEKQLQQVFWKMGKLVAQVRKGEKSLSALNKEQKKLVSLWLKRGSTEVLRRLLSEAGQFYRTTDSELMFFRESDHRLYSIEEQAFKRYLVLFTDNARMVSQEWLPKLQAWASFEAPQVTAQFLAYNDGPDLNVIAVNTFDGFMMRRKRGGKWERVPNGTDGILFLTPPEFLSAWEPDFERGGSGQALDWLCSFGHFADDGPLSVEDQQLLLRIWISQLFLPAVNPVHPIPLHEGVTGSGKSVLSECIGRWLTGPHFEVMDLPAGDPTKAEESLKLALWKRSLVVVDNVDSPSPWLEDFLCRVSTGVRMSRRRLYTNSDEVHFTPRAGLIVTSRDPHFRREDMARRLIPIRFRPIPTGTRQSETAIRRELDARRKAIWADVLVELGRVQDAWPQVNSTLQPSHSLADFSVFGAAVAISNGLASGEDWRGVMARLDAAQSRFATEQNPLAEVLRMVLKSNNGVVALQPVADLYHQVKESSKALGVPLPVKTLGALTKALKNQRQVLERALNAKIVVDPHHQGGEHWIAIVSVPPEANPDDVSIPAKTKPIPPTGESFPELQAIKI